MITEIEIKNIASYKGEKVIIIPKKINFFYGSNGSGKTTISKIIADPNKYLSCKVEWKGNRQLRTIVYNEDFVKRYFYQSEELPGIFTMSEGASEIEETINKIKKEIDKLTEEKVGLEKSKKKKETELRENFEQFKKACWESVYLKYKEDFKEVFKGYMASKEKFAKRIISENQNNNYQVKNLGELKRKYNLLFREQLYSLNKIDINKLLDFEKQLKGIENHEILQAKIIGKRDVNIAKMIQKLQNYDWVKQGREHYEKNYDEKRGIYYCPFCQQPTTLEFKKQLEEYFDETYEEQMTQLENIYKAYKNITQSLIQELQSIISIQSNKYLDAHKETLKDKIFILEKVIRENCNKFQTKLKNPSIPIVLVPLDSYLTDIYNIIEQINIEIDKHNKIVENQKFERQKLISEIWRFFVEIILPFYNTFQKNKKNTEKAIKSLKEKIEEKESKIEDLNKQILELEKEIKSVKTTVDAINQLLTSFGFTGFKLQATEDGKHYQIIREDGSLAKETLSEGERNFIVFLYFYHLIQGTLDPDEIVNEDKIVVIDDPVSSMDSNVLFIVATLIKELLHKIRNCEGNIKQIFVLTHNAYFFREVTYISSREEKNVRNDTQYFMVRKYKGISTIESHAKNPIKTTYQLLWDELKKDEIDVVSLQNIMRRILEFYFRILGEKEYADLINEFQNIQDKRICRSLIAWVNVGSHGEVFEDLNYMPQPEEIEKYKEIFHKIFEKTGHEAHYKMMMGIEE